MADGVAKGTAPNRAFSVRPAAIVATWLLMLVAVIVWNLGIGFFAYEIIAKHKYAFCKVLGASILGILPGRAGLGLGRRFVYGGWLGYRGGWLNRLKRNAVAELGGVCYQTVGRSSRSPEGMLGS